jgi:hypothetical protein
MKIAALAVEVEGLQLGYGDTGDTPEFVLEQLVQFGFGHLECGLFDLGISPEFVPASRSEAGQDIVVIGRVRLVDRDGKPAFDALEGDAVG